MNQNHLYDLLKNRVINPYEELNRLNNLFIYGIKGYGFNYQSLEDLLDKNVFKNLKMRDTFITISDMRNGLNLDEFKWYDSFDKLYLFCEFLYNLLQQGSDYISQIPEADKQAKAIIHNIMNILDKTNHELYKGSEDNYIIVEKNKFTSQAVELVEDEDVALKLIEYNHFKLKSDLMKKKEILNIIGNYIEPILKQDKWKNNGFLSLEDDAGFLLNNFDIRHNNREGRNKKEYIASMSDQILEEWYDKTYNTLLSVIIISEFIDTHNELKKWRQTNKNIES